MGNHLFPEPLCSSDSFTIPRLPSLLKFETQRKSVDILTTKAET